MVVVAISYVSCCCWRRKFAEQTNKRTNLRRLAPLVDRATDFSQSLFMPTKAHSLEAKQTDRQRVRMDESEREREMTRQLSLDGGRVNYNRPNGGWSVVADMN